MSFLCRVHGNQQARIPRPRGHPSGAGMLLSLSRLKESVAWRCLRRVIKHGQGNEESNMSGIPSTRRGSGFRGGTSRSALFFRTRSYKRLNDDPGSQHGRADGDRTRIRNALSGARPGLTRNYESHVAVSLQFGVQPAKMSWRSPKLRYAHRNDSLVFARFLYLGSCPRRHPLGVSLFFASLSPAAASKSPWGRNPGRSSFCLTARKS